MNKIDTLLSQRKNRIYTFLAIIALGLGLRLYSIDTHGIWVDEKISISHAIGGTKAKSELQNKEIVKPNDFWKHNNLEGVTWGVTNASGGNALLYAYTLHYWINTFGTTDFSIRFMSVLFSLISIFVFYKLAKALWSNNSFAMISAFLFTTNYLNIQYSLEARTYTLTIFLTLLSTLLLVHFLQSDSLKKKTLLAGAYLLIITLSFFGHFLIVSVLLGQGSLFLVMGRKKISNYVYLTICYSLFVLIALYYFKETDCLNKLNSNGDKWTIAAQDPSNNINTSFKNVFSEYFQMGLHLLGNGLNYTGIRVRYLIPLLALPLSLIFFAFKQKKNSIFVLGLGMIFSQLLFSTILAVKAGHTISFDPKYATFNQPYILLVFATGILYILHHTSNHLVMKGVIGAIVIINIISVYPIYLDNIVCVATDFSRKENGYIISTNKIKKYPEATQISVPSISHALIHSFYLRDTHYSFIIDKENNDVLTIKNNGEKDVIFNNINSESY